MLSPIAIINLSNTPPPYDINYFPMLDLFDTNERENISLSDFVTLYMEEHNIPFNKENIITVLREIEDLVNTRLLKNIIGKLSLGSTARQQIFNFGDRSRIINTPKNII